MRDASSEPCDAAGGYLEMLIAKLYREDALDHHAGFILVGLHAK
jgi:hypothetical protein